MIHATRLRRSRLAAALLLAAPALSAGGTVVGFEGANVGGWTYGPAPVIESGGGHPGAWLHAMPDTFAPQLRTTAPASPFAGNWRSGRIVSVGVDLLTVSIQFPASRPLSLILSNGSCQVYFLGSSLVPQPGTGWKAFDFAIDSQSTTMPPGWAILSGSCTQADAAWNAVITNVTQVNFFYGDPTFFFIFDIWNVGADNARIYSDPFTDVGSALAGTAGLPVLRGGGTLAGGSPVTLSLSSARPSSAAALFIGLNAINAPFKGGTLVPDADILITGLATDGMGQLVVGGSWPTGIAPGFTVWFQEWIADPAGPVGLAASNALQAVTP